MVLIKILFLIILFFLVGAGCGVRSNDTLTAVWTPTPKTTTVVSSPTNSPALSATSLPPSAQPTAAPVEGTTSTQVNVRAEPSTAGNVLGIIPADTKVEITGKDPAGNWWQILYPPGKDGKGWVTSQYVTTPNRDSVSVIGTDPDNGIMATVLQQINVRSGPGTGFNSLGILNARDVVHLTGKDANGAWLQIEFTQGGGPQGKGWINTAFVQAQGMESLPIISEAGEAIGTGTPTGIPPTPTATVAPAWDDQDSPDHPSASVAFEPLGTQTLIYKGDVSAPEGDPQDWIQFTPYTDTVYASLDCRGGINLQVNFLENGQPASKELACGDRLKPLSVRTGEVYLVHLQATQFRGGLQYTTYTVTIRMRE